ncbi:hypothetical protein EDC01DRAFT_426670 [Geopyxis carbonaria]|nr:hypothetical protein EDC01DRAFT_426670 [Geopyxis carbonaria]
MARISALNDSTDNIRLRRRLPASKEAPSTQRAEAVGASSSTPQTGDVRNRINAARQNSKDDSENLERDDSDDSDLEVISPRIDSMTYDFESDDDIPLLTPTSESSPIDLGVVPSELHTIRDNIMALFENLREIFLRAGQKLDDNIQDSGDWEDFMEAEVERAHEDLDRSHRDFRNWNREQPENRRKWYAIVYVKILKAIRSFISNAFTAVREVCTLVIAKAREACRLFMERVATATGLVIGLIRGIFQEWIPSRV